MGSQGLGRGGGQWGAQSWVLSLPPSLIPLRISPGQEEPAGLTINPALHSTRRSCWWDWGAEGAAPCPGCAHSWDELHGLSHRQYPLLWVRGGQAGALRGSQDPIDGGCSPQGIKGGD